MDNPKETVKEAYMDFMFLLETVVVLLTILLGAKLAGIGLGMAGGLGLFILTFIFGLKPATPPIDVMLIITAVVAAAATLQAGGGLDILVNWSEKLLRSHPDRITILAPITTYLSTIFCGTGYVSLCLYPVIAEVATEAGVRPERPMASSLTANQLAIVASPLSAAVAAMCAIMAPFGVTLGQILLVTVPATIVGSIVAILVVYNMGVELDKDPVYLEKVARGEIKAVHKVGEFVPRPVTKEAYRSLWIFCIVLLAVVFFGSCRSMAPSWVENGKTVIMNIPTMLEILMLSAGVILVLACKINVGDIIRNSVFQSGMMGVTSVFGIAWMMDTYFNAHINFFYNELSGIVQAYPILFAIVLFFAGAAFFSHGAATRAIMPLGVALGLAPASLVGVFPAVGGYFFIPVSGLMIACIAFDRTGTTKIGKWILNHSFMRAGLCSMCATVCVSYFLALVVI